MLKGILKYLWSMVRHPVEFYINNKTAIWFWIICITAIVLVMIPWFVGFITIMKWITL
jgi:hypothetical protein